MRQPFGVGLAALLALVVGNGIAAAQVAQPGAGQLPAGKAATGAPTRPANFNQVLATVNNEPITRGNLYNFLSRYPLPPGEETEIYQEAVNLVANAKLVNQFLVRQRVPVTEKELGDEIARIEKSLGEQGSNLKTRLAEANSSEAELKSDITAFLAWSKYAKSVATDAELKKYAETNKDVFGGAQVRASIIFLKADDTATPADKAKAKTKLEGIKAEIAANKIGFADAANKYSEDPRNVNSPSGGDLGYFRRKGDVFEELAVAAFALKPGAISDVVTTDIGVILVQVTDRKEGKPVDFEQLKPAIFAQYTAELQEKIITNERKTAKIDVKPMPADFFPKTPAGGTPAGAGGPAAKGAAGPGAAAPQPK